MTKHDAVTQLDLIASMMEWQACQLDKILKQLPCTEPLLIDQLCEVIGGALSVHKQLKDALRNSQQEEYVSNRELYRRATKENVIVFTNSKGDPSCA